MTDFAVRLQQLCDALESSTSVAPEQLSELAVEQGKIVSLAALRHMQRSLQEGASELEVMAAFPLALAFMVNAVLYCAGGEGNRHLADALFRNIRRVSHELGDGDPVNLLSSSAVRSH